jgi:phosphatidylserine decarboxylase
MKVYDRKSRSVIEEKVYGDFFVNLAYGSKAGAAFVSSKLVQKALSHLIGAFLNSKSSAQNIPSFIERYDIEMSDYIVPSGGYKSFNEFFIRAFRNGARNFPLDPSALPSPVEGRLSVFPIHGIDAPLAIKGEVLSVPRLLNSEVEAEKYIGGHALVFRLCPVDYHRFHFPDNGLASASTRLGGGLHSVNPLAQLRVPDVFLSNERRLCFFQSENFGRIAYIEVGALGVGKIVLTFGKNPRVARGQEKGYFSFGASTVILLLEPGKVVIDPDIIDKTKEGLESLVRLGETLGKKIGE